MNAAIDLRRLELISELEILRDQLQIAHEQIDYWRTRNLDEYRYWDCRVRNLQSELRIQQGCLQVVLSPDDKTHYGGREEEFEGASNGSIDWSRT